MAFALDLEMSAALFFQRDSHREQFIAPNTCNSFAYFRMVFCRIDFALGVGQ